MAVGIICAMDEEIADLKKEIKDTKVTTKGDINFIEGTIYNQPVVIVKSGIGKVAAGITAAMLLSNYPIDLLINSGSAAGIGKGMQVGDIVVSNETAYSDVDATASGYKIGQLPDQPATFIASSKLGDQIIKAAQTIKDRPYNIKKGLIVSGDQFIASKKQIKHILRNFPKALAAEMEGAAIGQVAYRFKVPYVVVRSMSDVGNEDANESFEAFLTKASHNSAELILNFLKERSLKKPASN